MKRITEMKIKGNEEMKVGDDDDTEFASIRLNTFS